MATEGKKKSKKSVAATVPIKDLQARKEQASKVKGGKTYGPEDL